MEEKPLFTRSFVSSLIATTIAAPAAYVVGPFGKKRIRPATSNYKDFVGMSSAAFGISFCFWNWILIEKPTPKRKPTVEEAVWHGVLGAVGGSMLMPLLMLALDAVVTVRKNHKHPVKVKTPPMTIAELGATSLIVGGATVFSAVLGPVVGVMLTPRFFAIAPLVSVAARPISAHLLHLEERDVPQVHEPETEQMSAMERAFG